MARGAGLLWSEGLAVARALHDGGARSGQVFSVVHCEQLIDASLELFGSAEAPSLDVVARVAGRRVEVADLPARFRFNASVIEGNVPTLREMEIEHIRAVLLKVGGNKTEAARLLDIDRKTLRSKVGVGLIPLNQRNCSLGNLGDTRLLNLSVAMCP